MALKKWLKQWVTLTFDLAFRWIKVWSKYRLKLKSKLILLSESQTQILPKLSQTNWLKSVEFAQRKSKSKVKLNFGLSLDFSVQLKVKANSAKGLVKSWSDLISNYRLMQHELADSQCRSFLCFSWISYLLLGEQKRKANILGSLLVPEAIE